MARNRPLKTRTRVATPRSYAVADTVEGAMQQRLQSARRDGLSAADCMDTARHIHAAARDYYTRMRAGHAPNERADGMRYVMAALRASRAWRYVSRHLLGKPAEQCPVVDDRGVLFLTRGVCHWCETRWSTDGVCDCMAHHGARRFRNSTLSMSERIRQHEIHARLPEGLAT